MLYLGNFSYNDDSDQADNYCLMPTVVEANSPDEALDRFAELFERIHTSSDLLDGAHEIYLDSLVELEGAPRKAVLTQWQKIVPAADGLCSISSALPEAATADATVYGWTDDDDDETDEESESDEPVEANEEPFLSFEDDDH